MKKIFKILVVVLLIVIIAISSFFLYINLKENKKQEGEFQELLDIVENVETKNETENQVNEVIKKEIDTGKLLEMNGDTVGWIKIEDTNINYPVMQNKSKSDYYLKRNFNKEYSSYGTPYVPLGCNIENSTNIIIYSHHMKNKEMFGKLEDYKSKKFYESHKTIEFHTLYEKREYEIFAVFKTTADNKGFGYYKFFHAVDESNYNAFVSKCKELSFYNTGILPKYGDRLLTLSTCEYSNANGRLVVVAKEI